MILLFSMKIVLSYFSFILKNLSLHLVTSSFLCFPLTIYYLPIETARRECFELFFVSPHIFMFILILSFSFFFISLSNSVFWFYLSFVYVFSCFFSSVLVLTFNFCFHFFSLLSLLVAVYSYGIAVYTFYIILTLPQSIWNSERLSLILLVQGFLEHHSGPPNFKGKFDSASYHPMFISYTDFICDGCICYSVDCIWDYEVNLILGFGCAGV